MPKAAATELIDEKAQKEAIKIERQKMADTLRVAKNVLADFMNTEIFAGLEDKVQDAIKRLAKKASNKKASSTVVGFLTGLFPEVGKSVDEFELFKATKMGRGEMRKKVHYALKKSAPEARMWVRFDEPSESWVLDAVGPDAPDNWKEADIPKL